MDKLTFERADDVIKISGEINYQTVPALLAASDRLLTAHQGPWAVNMAAVTRSDSTAIAWMLDWVRRSQKQQISLEFTQVSQAILDVAEVAGVRELLPIKQVKG